MTQKKHMYLAHFFFLLFFILVPSTSFFFRCFSNNLCSNQVSILIYECMNELFFFLQKLYRDQDIYCLCQRSSACVKQNDTHIHTMNLNRKNSFHIQFKIFHAYVCVCSVRFSFIFMWNKKKKKKIEGLIKLLIVTMVKIK